MKYNELRKHQSVSSSYAVANNLISFDVQNLLNLFQNFRLAMDRSLRHTTTRRLSYGELCEVGAIVKTDESFPVNDGTMFKFHLEPPLGDLEDGRDDMLISVVAKDTNGRAFAVTLSYDELVRRVSGTTKMDANEARSADINRWDCSAVVFGAVGFAGVVNKMRERLSKRVGAETTDDMVNESEREEKAQSKAELKGAKSD